MKDTQSSDFKRSFFIDDSDIHRHIDSEADLVEKRKIKRYNKFIEKYNSLNYLADKTELFLAGGYAWNMYEEGPEMWKNFCQNYDIVCFQIEDEDEEATPSHGDPDIPDSKPTKRSPDIGRESYFWEFGKQFRRFIERKNRPDLFKYASAGWTAYKQGPEKWEIFCKKYDLNDFHIYGINVWGVYCTQMSWYRFLSLLPQRDQKNYTTYYRQWRSYCKEKDIKILNKLTLYDYDNMNIYHERFNNFVSDIVTKTSTKKTVSNFTNFNTQFHEYAKKNDLTASSYDAWEAYEKGSIIWNDYRKQNNLMKLEIIGIKMWVDGQMTFIDYFQKFHKANFALYNEHWSSWFAYCNKMKISCLKRNFMYDMAILDEYYCHWRTFIKYDVNERQVIIPQRIDVFMKYLFIVAVILFDIAIMWMMSWLLF